MQTRLSELSGKNIRIILRSLLVYYSILSLIRTPGDHRNLVVLSGALEIEKALKSNKEVFVLTGILY